MGMDKLLSENVLEIWFLKCVSEEEESDFSMQNLAPLPASLPRVSCGLRTRYLRNRKLSGCPECVGEAHATAWKVRLSLRNLRRSPSRCDDSGENLFDKSRFQR